MKVKWKVAPAPTGPYRSFETRGWPTAEYEDGNVAAMIHCDDEYRPDRVKEGDHAELKLYVADWSTDPWTRRLLVKRPATVADAKILFARFIEANPHMMPKKKDA